MMVRCDTGRLLSEPFSVYVCSSILSMSCSTVLVVGQMVSLRDCCNSLIVLFGCTEL